MLDFKDFRFIFFLFLLFIRLFIFKIHNKIVFELFKFSITVNKFITILLQNAGTAR